MNNLSANTLAARAQACLDHGDVQLAIKLFSELNISEPMNAEAWLMSGALLGETGATQEAVAFIQKAISINPNYPEAYLTLSHLYKATNALDESYDAVKKALEIDSNYDEAWVHLGVVCCDLSRFEEAENASRQALSRWPENTQAHISLAIALCNFGRENEAEPLVRRIIELEGGSFPAINPLLGRILLGKNEFDDAEIYIQSALQVAPNDLVLLVNLATIKLGQKHLDQAENLFLKIIKISPDSTDAWAGLADTYQNQYKLEQAEECYIKAVSLESLNFSTAYKLALLQETMGRFDEAENTLRTILEKSPGQLDTVGALAGLLEKAGKFDAAIDTIDPVLSIAERSVPVALALQKLCNKMERCEDAVNYIDELIESSTLRKGDLTALHFSLGNLYDRQGKFDDAFKQFSCANELTTHGYHPNDYTAYISKMISTFSPSMLKEAFAASNTSEQPVFIVGMPRSGTSLIEQILSSHSEVFGAGELRLITELTETITDKHKNLTFPESVTSISQTEMNDFAQHYFDTINKLSGSAVRVTDKLPHNFQYIGLIYMLFPNAKIIHCRRDARDTCLSCFSMNFFGHHPYTSNLDYLGRHYKDYQRLMSHWSELNIPMFEIQYEDLVEDPEKWSKQLIDYCGLDWEEDCLRFYENGRRTRTASYDQVRQPIYKNAVARWKNYESHLNPLFQALQN